MSIGKKILYYFKVKKYFFLECLRNFRYYNNLNFLLFDICFSFLYLFINPYRTSRKFLEKKFCKKIYDYGETPTSQIKKIIDECDLTSKEKILELGAGRGKLSFSLYFFLNCQVYAIEQIPIFVNIANFLKFCFRIKKVKFMCSDFFDFEIRDFDVIYLYGTTLENLKIKKLINKFKKLPSYVKIITISYPLDEYDLDFKCIKSFDMSFPWGDTKAYLNIKKN